MLERLSSAALLASLLLTASAGAEPVAAPKPAASSEVRRDPRGLKGISPFAEALERGDSALRARDVDGAILAYRDALAKEPENALGLYRLGEAQILKGDLPAAEEAFGSGLRLVAAANPSLKAKLEFAFADLRERQKNYDEASAKWTEYELFASAQKVAFPASGSERKKVLETWKKLTSDSLAVKARIEKGLKAADDSVRKSSQ